MIVYEVKYDTKSDSLHDRLLKGLRKRLDLCKERRGSLDTRVDENERRCSLYKKKNPKDNNKVKAKKGGESEYSEVVVPYSYALMISAHTYLIGAFLQRDPVFGVQGLQDEGQLKELALETFLRYQYNSGDMGKHMLIWLLDPCRFGLGLIGSYWEQEEKVITSIESVPEEEDGIVVVDKFKNKFIRKVIKGYEGNKLFNVHPKDFIFDPRVPMNSIQDMEFCGRKTSISILDATERQTQKIYFNVDEAIKNLKGDDKEKVGDVDRVLDELTGASKVDKSNEILETPISGKTGQLQLEEVSITLIPKQWGISEAGDRPEKWHFTIANEKYIICAYPQGTYHQEHPFHGLEMELDGYKQDSRSLTELAEPMNDVLTWMFNSHMWNKRASMNNQFVYNPLHVEERDVKSTKAGKLIRLKPTAYGLDVRSVIHQIPVADVTANSVQDAISVEKMMQRLLGANEDVAGGASTSSRRSATEFNATTGFSVGRLARDALHFSLTGVKSLGRQLISNSQQFYTAKQKLKIGGYTGFVDEVIDVTPETIAGMFDVIPNDGTMPVSKMQQANFWKEALMGMANIPEVRQVYKIEDIFAHMSRLGGLISIEKFRIEPDEKVKRMIEMGLIENVAGGNTGNAGSPPRAAAEPSTGTPGVGDPYGSLSVSEAAKTAPKG